MVGLPGPLGKILGSAEGAFGGGGVTPVDPGPAWVEYDERQLDGATLVTTGYTAPPGNSSWWEPSTGFGASLHLRSGAVESTGGSWDLLIGAPYNQTLTVPFDQSVNDFADALVAIVGAGFSYDTPDPSDGTGTIEHSIIGHNGNTWTIHNIPSDPPLGMDLTNLVQGDGQGLYPILGDAIPTGQAMTQWPNLGTAGSEGDAAFSESFGFTGYVVATTLPTSDQGIFGATVLVDDAPIGPGWTAGEDITPERIKVTFNGRTDAEARSAFLGTTTQILSTLTTTIHPEYAAFQLSSDDVGNPTILSTTSLGGEGLDASANYENLVLEAAVATGHGAGYDACMVSGERIPPDVLAAMVSTYNETTTTEVGDGVTPFPFPLVEAAYPNGGLVMPLDPGEEWTIFSLWYVGTDGSLDGEEWCPLTTVIELAYDDCYVYGGQREVSYYDDYGATDGAHSYAYGLASGDAVIVTKVMRQDGQCIVHFDGFEAIQGTDQTLYGTDDPFATAPNGVALDNYPGGGYCAPGRKPWRKVFQKACTQAERLFVRQAMAARAVEDGFSCTLYDEAPPPPPPGPPVPSAPQNLAVDAGTPGEFALTWDAPSAPNDLTGYTVYRDDVLLATTDAVTLTFTDDDPPAEFAVTYTVTATSAGGEGGPSDPVSAIADPGPFVPADWNLAFNFDARDTGSFSGLGALGATWTDLANGLVLAAPYDSESFLTTSFPGSHGHQVLSLDGRSFENDADTWRWMVEESVVLFQVVAFLSGEGGGFGFTAGPGVGQSPVDFPATTLTDGAWGLGHGGDSATYTVIQKATAGSTQASGASSHGIGFDTLGVIVVRIDHTKSGADRLQIAINTHPLESLSTEDDAATSASGAACVSMSRDDGNTPGVREGQVFAFRGADAEALTDQDIATIRASLLHEWDVI